MDVARGTATILVQGQVQDAEAALFTGSSVALVDAVFSVNSGVAIEDAEVTVLQVGTAVDPVYLSSTASNGDDISRTQDIAQVRSWFVAAQCQQRCAGLP